jgi:carboxypeptidase family protein
MIARALSAMSLVVLLAADASAQLASQTALVGTVKDSSGGVLPGASVVATNINTQDTYETTTNEQGYFNVQFVHIGTYKILVSLSGFQPFNATGIEIATNRVVRRDVTLALGVVVETVQVEAGVILATENPTVATTISERAVVDLPLNGRNVWSLASSTPGVLSGTSSFSGAGQRNIQNSLSLDGINTASNIQTNTTMRPIADAVTEVAVQTGSTSAEYGAYLGVAINVVTKSGTNVQHGSLFEFRQNQALAARGYFEDRSKPKNPTQFDQFGFESDGPLIIPRLYDGRNKTFFMGAYEGVRQLSQLTTLDTVLTERMRQGDFSEFKGTIRNPFTGLPYPNNQIPAAELSPQALRLLQYIPQPNQSGTGSNLLDNSSSNNSPNQILARVDQNIGNKVRLYGRYNWQGDSIVNTSAITVNNESTFRHNRNTVFAYTHTLTPNMVNDFVTVRRTP